MKLSLLKFSPLLLLLAAAQCSGPTTPAPKVEPEKENQGGSGSESKIASNGKATFDYGYSTVGFPVLLEKYGKQTCFNDLYDELNPELLRFPGGTIANFYHTDGPGYGFRPEDVKMINGTAIAEHMNRELQRQKLFPAGTPNFLNSFLDYVKNDDISVLLVANVYTGTIQENLDMIEAFKSKGINIKGIELGNEGYLAAYSDEYPNGEAYWKSIQPYKKAIEAKYPEIPLGIVLAPTTFHKETSAARETKFENWNKYLSQQKGYDAVVTHIYPLVTCKASSLEAQYQCAQQSLKKFVAKDLTGIYNEFSGLYPGKAIWVTEWNIRLANAAYGNSFVQAAFIADFMNTSFIFGKDNNTDMLLTFHNMSGGKGGAGNCLMSEAQKAANDGCGVEKRAAYFAFNGLKDCFDGLERITTRGAKGLEAVTYSGSSGTRYLLISGESSNENAKSKAVELLSSKRCTTLSFENSYAGNGPITGKSSDNARIQSRKGTFTFGTKGLKPYQLIFTEPGK